MEKKKIRMTDLFKKSLGFPASGESCCTAPARELPEGDGNTSEPRVAEDACACACDPKENA